MLYVLLQINQMFYNSTLLGELYNRSEVISISSTSSSLQKPVVRIQLKILLNRPDVMIAEKMALVFVNNLQQKEDSRFLEGLSVNLTSIKFTGTCFSFSTSVICALLFISKAVKVKIQTIFYDIELETCFLVKLNC